LCLSWYRSDFTTEFYERTGEYFIDIFNTLRYLYAIKNYGASMGIKNYLKTLFEKKAARQNEEPAAEFASAPAMQEACMILGQDGKSIPDTWRSLRALDAHDGIRGLTASEEADELAVLLYGKGASQPEATRHPEVFYRVPDTEGMIYAETDTGTLRHLECKAMQIKSSAYKINR
jgi:hypothetical protein